MADYGLICGASEAARWVRVLRCGLVWSVDLYV